MLKTVELEESEWGDVLDAIEKWSGEMYRDEDYDKFQSLYEMIEAQIN